MMHRSLLLGVLFILAIMVPSAVVTGDAMPSQRLISAASWAPALSNSDCADELRAEQTLPSHCHSEAASAIFPAHLPFWRSDRALVPSLATVRLGFEDDVKKRPPKPSAA